VHERECAWPKTTKQENNKTHDTDDLKVMFFPFKISFEKKNNMKLKNTTNKRKHFQIDGVKKQNAGQQFVKQKHIKCMNHSLPLFRFWFAIWVQPNCTLPAGATYHLQQQNPSKKHCWWWYVAPDALDLPSIAPPTRKNAQQRSNTGFKVNSRTVVDEWDCQCENNRLWKPIFLFFLTRYAHAQEMLFAGLFRWAAAATCFSLTLYSSAAWAFVSCSGGVGLMRNDPTAIVGAEGWFKTYCAPPQIVVFSIEVAYARSNNEFVSNDSVWDFVGQEVAATAAGILSNGSYEQV